MTTSASQIPRSSRRKARAEAAAWVVQLHGPHRSPELEAAFRHWLAVNDENRQEFERVTEVWDDARGITAGSTTWISGWSRPAGRRRWY